jgi:hypothetical protein
MYHNLNRFRHSGMKKMQKQKIIQVQTGKRRSNKLEDEEESEIGR